MPLSPPPKKDASEKEKTSSIFHDDFGSDVVRAFFISLGLICAGCFFDEFWIKASQVTLEAKLWVGQNSLFLLGCSAVFVGLFWKKLSDWLFWMLGLFGNLENKIGKISVGFALLMISAGLLKLEFIGPFLGFVMLWIGFCTIFLGKNADHKIHPDHYHRTHLVERLAGLLLDTPENIRRIGILAEWGEGKTQVLKLLEQHLNRHAEKKFRIAWVNPWRSASSDDAWVEIARGVDEALGFPRLLPRSLLSLPGIGTLLEHLPKPISGLTSDLKTLLTSEGSVADKIAIGLAEFLRSKNQWLLIFVDDMERVSPEELRKIFPVIDRLIDLERCYFLFAIDPNRIAKAFAEDSSHGGETKGYLDKILDLQMSLPMISRNEVLEMIRGKIDHQCCPKFSAIVDKLEPHLPANPRLADRFLRDADGLERMFLDRFGADEENYEGFFLLLLLRIRFPKAFAVVKAEPDLFEKIQMAQYIGYLSSHDRVDNEYSEIIDRLSDDGSLAEKEDLHGIVKRLHELCSIYLRHDYGEKSLDVAWALEGYCKLIRFTFDERRRFGEAWSENAGKASLVEILARVGDFSEPELVVSQALELELDGIKGDFDQIYGLHFEGQSISKVRDRIIQRLDRFVSHAKAMSAGGLERLDRSVFGRQMFDLWMNLLERSSLRGLPSDFVEDMTALRKEFTASLVDLFEEQKKYEFSVVEVDDRIRFARDNVARDELRLILDPLKISILEGFSDRFVELLVSQPIVHFYPPKWMGGISRRDIRDPSYWLPHDEKKARYLLKRLSSEARSNEILHANFVWMIRHELLNPYRLSAHDGHREQEGARRAIKEFPWYLRGCWEAAWSRELSPGVHRDMLTLRSKALEIEEVIGGNHSIKAILEDLPFQHEKAP